MFCCLKGIIITLKKRYYESKESRVKARLWSAEIWKDAPSLPPFLLFHASEPASTLRSPLHGCAERQCSQSANIGSIPGQPQNLPSPPMDALSSVAEDWGSGPKVYKQDHLGQLTSVPRFSPLRNGDNNNTVVPLPLPTGMHANSGCLQL